MKKVLAIAFSIICLLSFSLVSFAAPEGSQRYTGTVPLYIDWQNNDGGFSPTSVTLVDTTGKTTTLTSNDGVITSQSFYTSGYAILRWEIEVPFVVYVENIGRTGDTFYDGSVQFVVSPSISLSSWSSSSIQYFDNADKYSSMEFALTNGTRLLCARTAQSASFVTSWSDEALNRLSGTYGGTISYNYTVTVAGPDRGLLSGTTLAAACTQTKLFITANAGTTSGTSRMIYTIDTYTAAQRAAEEQDEMLNGYENSAGNAAIDSGQSAVESGVASEDQELDSAGSLASDFDYEEADLSSLATAFSLISGWFMAFVSALGGFNMLIYVSLALVVALFAVGYFRH